MKAVIVAPIVGVEFEKQVITRDYMILKDATFNEKHLFTLKEFEEQFGGVNLRQIKDNFIFFWEGETTVFESIKQLTRISDVTNVFGNSFVDTLLYLWFIKDNSASIANTFGISQEIGKASIGSASLTTNAKGEHVVVQFYDKEFDDMLMINDKISDAFDNEMLSKEHSENALDTSRFTRAFNYLVALRFRKNVIQKITHHMSILDCLFTSNIKNQDIGRLLRSRVPRFLGGNKVERNRVKFLIIEAYNIRSRYVHGDVISYTKEQLQGVSIRVDELSRKIFTKILFQENNDMFTRVEDEEKNRDFEHYFNHLVASKGIVE
jgi:hypothetical protein